MKSREYSLLSTCTSGGCSAKIGQGELSSLLGTDKPVIVR